MQLLKHTYVLSDRDFLDRWGKIRTDNTSAVKRSSSAGKIREHLLADRGYRGSESAFLSTAHIAGMRRVRGKANPDQQHRQNSIEPVIGHLTSDGLMFRSFLRGLLGTSYTRY